MTVSVPPEVEVTASRSRVGLGDFVTLFCNTRTNPEANGTVWTYVNTGMKVSEDADTLVLNLLTTADFGTYCCTVTNTAGETGSGNVMIEQGCKF